MSDFHASWHRCTPILMTAGPEHTKYPEAGPDRYGLQCISASATISVHVACLQVWRLPAKPSCSICMSI